MESHAWMSETSVSGVGSLQLVARKFTMKKEAEDRQFPTRQSRNFEQIMCQVRRITLDDLCILVPEVS